MVTEQLGIVLLYRAWKDCFSVIPLLCLPPLLFLLASGLGHTEE